MSVMSDPKTQATIKKQQYREQLKLKLGDEEYKKQEREKKQAYRAKIKQNIKPVEPINNKQIIIIKNKLESEPKKEQKKITNFFKPEPKPEPKTAPKPEQKITNYFKPITKERFLTNIKNEPIKDLLKQIKKHDKLNKNNEININNDLKRTIKKKSNVESIENKAIKKTKSTEPTTIRQYLKKISKIYKFIFNKDLEEIFINNLFNSILLNNYDKKLLINFDFLNDIDLIIKTIHNNYKNKNTQATYINAFTSILARIPNFNKQYNIISKINNKLSQEYQEERDKNEASPKVINNLIQFDETYINKLLNGINDINDKALIAIYTLAPPRRLKDYYLMKISNFINLNNLDKNYNHIVIKNNKPYIFLFYNHKTKNTSEPAVLIPNELIIILSEYIKYNNLVENDYLFGRQTTNFKNPYSQPKFTELIQKTFLKYTNKKISANLLRRSKATQLNKENLSISEHKKIAEKMGHTFKTSMQYSAHKGLKK